MSKAKRYSTLIPQGSFLERKRFQKRSKLKMVVFVVLGFHVAVLGLIQGCRHNQEKEGSGISLASSNSAPGSYTLPTNAPALAEPAFTNPAINAIAESQTSAAARVITQNPALT